MGLLRQAFVGDVSLGNTEKILYGIMKDGVDVNDVDIVGRIFLVCRIIDKECTPISLHNFLRQERNWGNYVRLPAIKD